VRSRERERDEAAVRAAAAALHAVCEAADAERVGVPRALASGRAAPRTGGPSAVTWVGFGLGFGLGFGVGFGLGLGLGVGVG